MQRVQNVIVVYLENCKWFDIFTEEFESLLLMFEKAVIGNFPIGKVKGLD